MPTNPLTHPRRRAALTLVVLSALVVSITGVYLLGPSPAQAVPVAFKPLVVGLGDSYASGEGASSSGPWADENCHRSNLATTPAAVTLANQARVSASDIDVIHLACTGARTTHLFTPFTPSHGLGGNIGGTTVPGQIPTALAQANGRPIDTMVISIGGNDMGFATIAQACWSGFWDCSDQRRGRGSTLDLVTRNLATLGSTTLPSLMGSLRPLLDNGSVRRVIFTGYPEPTTGDDGSYCGDLTFTTNEWRFASEQVVRPLNVTIQRAVDTTADRRIEFLPAPDFTGHGVCASDPWAHGVNLLRVDDSLHPTEAGYVQLAANLERRLRSLPTMVADTRAPETQSLLDHDGPNGAATLTLTAKDPGFGSFGLARIEYEVFTTATTNIGSTTQPSIALSLGTATRADVRYRAVDAAGNAEAWHSSSFSAKPTATPPSLQLVAALGTTSTATVQLRNTGNLTQPLGTIDTDHGDFAVRIATANPCGAVLRPNATCDVEVSFTPWASGTETTKLRINGWVSVSTLTGIGGTPIATVTPSPVLLAATDVGSSSFGVFDIANTGPVPLVVSGLALDRTDGVTLLPNSCSPPTTIPAGGKCTAAVVFAPTRAGTHSRTIALTSNAPGGPQTIWVTGQAVGAAAVTFDPGSIDLGDQPVGTTGVPREVLVRNSGTDNLRITGAATSGTAAGEVELQGGSCLPRAGQPDVLVEIGASCTLRVALRPGGIGGRTASVTMTTATGPLGTLAVQANGVPAAAIQAAPTALVLGATTVGSASAPAVVTLTNNSTSPFTVAGIKATDRSFRPGGTDTCTGTTVPVGGSCQAGIVHTPGTAGDASASVVFVDPAGGQLASVPVSGTGTAGVASVDPAELAAARWNSPGLVLPVTVTNTGNGLLDLRTVEVTGDFRKRSYGCQGFFLPPGSSCEVLVGLVPYQPGSYSGALVLTSAGPDAIWRFDLHGLVS